MRRLTLFLLVLSAFLPLAARELPSLAGWMSALPDETPIHRMSVPGSHDSGAVCGNVFLKVQDAAIARQLEMGVRFFDIRLKADSAPGITVEDAEGEGAAMLGVYHSGQFMEQTWDGDILPAMRRFLKENPREFLIVLLKCEGGSRKAFARLLGHSLTGAEDITREFAPSLTLGECRGRIIFLLRDEVDGAPMAARVSGWDDNVTCHITISPRQGKTGTACVEDEYGYDSIAAAHYKTLTTLRNMAAAALQRPAPDGSPCWYISYASCHAVPNNSPGEFAERVSPAVEHGMAAFDGPLGIVLIDFCAQYSDLIRMIVERN